MPEERRLVTVLFADVVGSTALGERLDPEDVRAIMARLFAIARDAVERHGGVVEKFIGDAVMAVFGVPAAHDDDPARACAAALELRDRVRADAVLGERIEIRLGLATGEVIAAREADATEFLVTGDPVNAAARLQQGAEAWAILAAERTALAARARFLFGDAVGVDAKGKSAPIAARPLTGPVPSAGAPLRTRLIGRDPDLAELRLAGDRAFRERRPYLVSVIAPAGTGKSRLLDEFLDGLDPSTTIALAQCLPYGQRLTYWPLRAILLAILGLPSDASPERIREALGSWLEAAGAPDAARTADLVAATIGAAEAEGMDRHGAAGAWRQLVELVAERSPLVLVVEDLHWSSDSLLDLVEAVLQPRANVPLLMVALARPELLDRRPSWGGGRRNAVSISLEPLPDDAVAELVADLLANPAPAIVDAVVERADGNPFYAGEIVRSLREAVGSASDADAVRAAVASLPDTVHGTVLARLDTLDPTARRVVQLGSVLGRSFEIRALAALDADLTTEASQLAVDALADRDLVRLSGRGATFRHILIREVAYGTLPRRERASLHAGAGTWLEAEAAASGREDELAELVAFHLREAASLGSLLGEAPPVDLVDRAVRWLRRAAESADAGGAREEAARHLEAAIALSPRESQPDLYERLGQIWVGGEQAIEAFERAHALGLELGAGPDQELRSAAQSMIVYTRWSGAGTLPISREDGERRIKRIRELTESTGSDRARLLGELALAFGPPQEVVAGDREAARRALELARRLDDPDRISEALDAFSTSALADGRVDEVMDHLRERSAISHRLAIGERFDIAGMTAWMEVLRGNLEAAEKTSEAARAWVAGTQAASWSLSSSAWRIVALHALGRWDEALAEAARAERSWTESAMRSPSFALGGFLAALAVSRGRADADGVLRWSRDCRTIIERTAAGSRARLSLAFVDGDLPALEAGVVHGFRRFEGRQDYVHLALALLADRRHPGDPAVLDGIVEHEEARGVRLVAASARRLRGILRGEPADLEAAQDAFESMRARPFAARVRSELGLLRGEASAVAAGLAELERVGDVDQASRVTTEAAESDLLHG